MAMTTPDWLARRDGGLRMGYDGLTWLVLFNGGPQYELTPIPAAGRFSCAIVETVSSERLDEGATYPTDGDALRGGLEELRTFLGW